MRVAINGCGIAGPTLAWWLRKYGHEPVLFERAEGFRDGGYIIDFWGSGYRVAGKMGLIPRLREDGYIIERLESHTLRGMRTAAIDASVFVEIAGGDYLSIARSDLAAAILDACHGIETRFGTTVTGYEESGEGVSVALSDGSHEEFDLLVGADGLHSAVRSMAFGPQEQFERPLGLHVAAATLKGYRPRDELAYVQFTRPNRQISRASLKDDTTMVLFVFADSLIEREPQNDDDARTTLRRIFGGTGWECDAILAALEDSGPLYFDKLGQIYMPHWAKGRVALLGDAAACLTLLAGEGTGLAMTEAYVLAGELHNANGDHARAFAAYEQRLQAYLAKKQASALRLKGFFAPKSWWGVGLREAATLLAAVPFLSRPILGAGMTDDFTLPDY
ncbi:FAD-binding domain [Porphyrobacter algicida]|uniref:FAD-binding domain n=1 Tax=Qipengyuania algicida TaxID=1836209 RepID=A0A845ACZ6_9SPHN|nr:FAD-binding domain [Qipengyuania algicida]MXP28130.1 FAD-binding domain [Qipengyuania algicida]